MTRIVADTRTLVGDRILWMAVLIVACFVAVLLLPDQSGASYASYALALLMLATFPRWKDVFKLDLMRWIVLLLAWLSLSVTWSDPFEWRAALSVWVRVLLVLLFVVATAECQLRGQLQKWMGIALTTVGAIAVVAAIGNFILTDPQDGRLNGLGQLDTHVVAALVYGVILLFVLRIAMGEYTNSIRFAAWCIVLVIASAVALSDSRNAWVAVVLAALVFVAAHRIKDARSFLVVVASIIFISGVGLFVLYVNEDIRSVLFPRGASFRIEIWGAALDRLREGSPLIGLGVITPDDFVVGDLIFSHPHSMYVALLYQGGMVGLLLYMIVLWKSLSALLLFFDHKDAKLALSIFALALSAHLLDEHELVDKVGSTWFLIWLPVAISLGLMWRPFRLR